jgi:thiamine biosynthesis lipoprotein
MIEHSFSRMGTSVKVLLPAGDEAMLDFVHARSWNLEALWSRFIGTSDIAMLALAGGQAVQVATETIELVEQMLQAHFATEGFFDPTLMAALNEAGYSKSKVSHDLSVLPVAGGSSALSDVRIDHNTNEITLPAGMSLDPGGIGKGMAADLIARDLMDMGVQGVSISMGGDVALAGTPDDGDNWVVNIGAPHDYTEVIDTVRLRAGGVATSTLAARTWDTDGEHRHHVIDPRTRKPVSVTPISTLQACVVAGSAAWAEAFATALTVCASEDAERLVIRHNLAALLILHNGQRIELGSWAALR